VPSHTLQQAISNLDNSYTNFFKGRASFPKYKKKQVKGSFKIPIEVKVDFEQWTVKLPKYGLISINIDRKFNGIVRNSTVSRTPTGRYFISILVDTLVKEPELKPIKESSTVGIDLGIKHFAVLSDGRKIDNPRSTLKFAKVLRREQRILSRKKKGSKRRKRQVLRVAKVHESITNKRKDFLHKLSTEITNQYDTICLETLNVEGLKQNKKLAKHISDASWGEFVRQLEYKAKWKGKNILRIGRFEPSSKMCMCGKINNELKLSDREWTCKHCNATHDRDLLAANNIKTFGLKTPPNIRQRKALAYA
jgi:putative transposase